MNKEKYVYYDESLYEYKDIPKEFLKSPKKLVNYFGYIEDRLNDNDEMVIYKLVPHITLKKRYNL